MKIYNLKNGVGIAVGGHCYLLNSIAWDDLINRDDALAYVHRQLDSAQPIPAFQDADTLSPLGQQQELWACGVTYLRSKVGREEESKDSGASAFYAHVYEADRPETFFKATPHRVVGHLGTVQIREDSTWNVPEPELTLVVTSNAKIIGYTIGNDMSSRSIEGENPLYLPQAKVYDGCAALGPGIYLSEAAMPVETMIKLLIKRSGAVVVDGSVALSQMKRTPEELIRWIFQACSFPYGCMVMTGTGIVPDSDFTLQSQDEIQITIDHIGTLVNTVR